MHILLTDDVRCQDLQTCPSHYAGFPFSGWTCSVRCCIVDILEAIAIGDGIDDGHVKSIQIREHLTLPYKPRKFAAQRRLRTDVRVPANCEHLVR